MSDISDVLTVSFDSGVKDESVLCITRKYEEKIIVLKMEYGEQADILYQLLIEQMTKAEIKSLEQEPCEDEYIKVPKKALKYRTAGMVAYNAEWLKNHFDLERVAICGAQQPCEDAIRRQAVLDKKELVELEDGQSFYCISPEDVETLPSVTPQPKTGHWIRWYERKENDRCIEHIPHCKCSECGKEYDPHSSQFIKYCNECGAKIVEPQESEE